MMLRFVFGALAALSLTGCGPQSVSEAPLTRIAFGSCINQYETEAILDAVVADAPDLFLFLGDNVYGDVSSAEMEELQEAYQVASENPSYTRLRASVPHLATWDDHDYGTNDGGEDFPYREQSEALFHMFWETPENDARRTREGVYYAQSFGPEGQRVQVIMLDTRSFRSPWTLLAEDERDGFHRYVADSSAEKTMLGVAQWNWLEEHLLEPAELRLVVSSIQVMAEGHALERWGNFPSERQRLYDLIADTGATGVVLLSGDQHVAGFYEATEGVPYRLIEFSSSSMGIPFQGERPEPDRARLGDLFTPANFGRITIDWLDRSVLLEIVDERGEVRDDLVLSLETLNASPGPQSVD